MLQFERLAQRWPGIGAGDRRKLEQQQMGECVQDKMDLLPPDYRTVLILSDLMTFSQKEIAEILGISVNNVKVKVHRARKKFRAILEEHCSFEVDERSVLVCEPAHSENLSSTDR